MFFAIDIDGVLAKDTIGYATYMNRHFGIGIPDEIIEGLTNGYAEFIKLEEVLSFIYAHGLAKEFNRVVKEAQYDALVQELKVPIDGAVESLHSIAKRYPFQYVTCRKAETLEVTQAWLTRYGFPEPERVSCCEWMHYKYLTAHQMAADNEPLIFIDDLASNLMRSFKPLVKNHYEEAKEIRKRSSLLAFGYDEAPAWPFKKPLHPVKALPNWGAFDTVMGDGMLPEGETWKIATRT